MSEMETNKLSLLYYNIRYVQMPQAIVVSVLFRDEDELIFKLLI